ncbi:hypothetical protein GCM10011344_08640 [Dokdonia pacifica]|uniref:DUF349 domain-containing protein n=1 Tax=Dokdonia pacifica TaxID=1627892 RepID=A0A238YSY6_9FLAO|nr:DUF349 domain-containing protein [Dokdonia pacifica]GGG10248.1 hypothetical protein GCM10011344_08640 [Dokdonia pacifica]SNR74160.1 protein of unknown function [Dokdonia pacifica]
MSEEKQSQETEGKINDAESVEETTPQPERGLEEEIEALAAEAEATELPTEETVESEIDETEAEVEADVEAEVTEEAKEVVKEEAVVEEVSSKEIAVEPKEIPKKDYPSLSKEELLEEFKTLLDNEKVHLIKDHVDGIKSAIDAKFNEEQETAKAAFIEEGGNVIDFRYFSPLKKDFNETYYTYRHKRANHYQNKQKDQKANLEYRQQLIEEVKQLREELGGTESIQSTFNKFKDIQERWHNAGNIPRDRYNLVWNNYYHHIDNFYELLHLNREFRDKHFQDNLAKKLQLIERAEELASEPKISKAFKELQLLHRMWKEEIGPVAKEYSDEIWDKFSAATKKIHDARDAQQKEVEASWGKNLEVKREIIEKLDAIKSQDVVSHQDVQSKVKEVEALREAFFKSGRVPNDVNEEVWSSFKGVVREFNHKKNLFYKSQKKQQFENLHKKLELIKIAEDNKDNEDFSATIEVMKKVQADWKKIGHVPRKDSDKIWKQFKNACNHFFDRLHDSKKKANAGEEEAYVKKEALLETVKGLKLEGSHQENLTLIKEHISSWKAIGRVPYGKRKIDELFNKELDNLFGQLDIDKKESEMIRYENRMQSMVGENDTRALEKEQFFISKKVQEIKAEINQLENNLGFFQHVADDNPLVKEVHKNINKHKESLAVWVAKLKKVRQMITDASN